MSFLTTLNIPSRFNGPDNSANGGYTAGLVATQVDYPIRIRLHQPPPLDKAMKLVADDEKNLKLMDGDQIVASAQPYDFELVVPSAPHLAEAKEAAKHYEGFDFSPFPCCFVCGHQRPEKDGLEIYAGHYEGNKVAAPWLPTKEWSSNGETVDELYLWAALDCPGAYSIPDKGEQAVVLGQMAAKFLKPVQVDETYIVTGWTIAVDGRKIKAGTALFTATGETCAYAEQTWIILK